MKFVPLCLVCLSLVACQQTGLRHDQADNTTLAASDVPSRSPGAITDSKTTIALNVHRDMVDLTGFKDLGAFHFRRLHFYSKKNPGISIGPAKVEQVTLYFIDRTIVKLRYKLSEDISGYLVDSLTTNTERAPDLKRSWSKYRQLRWNYFNKTIIYQNRCPEEDLANELTNEKCDSGYWLYAELPGYRTKVKELETVAKYVREYLIDEPPNKASPD